MDTSKVIYLGELRTEAEHLKSGSKIITDAPTDNQGRGRAFSPTDLLATSLGSCILTTMAIACQGRDLNMDGAKAIITKVMAPKPPRRVAEVHVQVTMPHDNYTAEEKELLEAIGKKCPVALSLHPNIIQNVNFAYSK